MHSPPVQPISSSRSGTGSVRTMWEEVTVSALRSGAPRRLGGGPEGQHGGAGANDPGGGARHDSIGAVGRGFATGEPSQISTPLARSRSRNPNASRAGCTVAAPG